MTVIGLFLVAVPVALAGYAYLLYPVVLRMLPRAWQPPPPDPAFSEWPVISITLAAYNEEQAIAATLDTLLTADYPVDRRQIIVISDASTDRTDEIVRAHGDRGVELIRLPARAGKTAAENASRERIRGEIVINTDATVRIAPDALKSLVRVFRDPTIGVASGRDVSIAADNGTGNAGESRYVGYEMWVRDLETRAGGIVGASGCFYASRRDLHGEIVPAALSRDFAAPLIAREQGYRSVSVRDAVCFVPRTPSLRSEYRRKVRTMARGLDTLHYKRHLLNPLRHGRFAWMLASHKLARWLVPWSLLPGLVGLVLLGFRHPWIGWAVAGVGLVGGALAVLGWRRGGDSLPAAISSVGYAAFGIAAGAEAWIKALRRDLNPVWEPTRRQ